MLLDLHASEGLPVCLLRPGLVVGEGSSPFHSGLGLFNNEQHCVGWNAGRNPLPFVLVQDVAQAILLAMRASDGEGRCYNLVGDVRPNARAYVAALARATGRPLRFHPSQPAVILGQEYGKWLIKRAGGRALRRRPAATCCRAACWPASTAATPSAISAGVPSRIRSSSCGWRSRRMPDEPATSAAQRVSELRHRWAAGALHQPDQPPGVAWRHAIVSINGRDECAARISPDLDVRFPAVETRRGALLANLWSIRRTLEALRPDVLLTHNWGSIEWVLANLSVGVRHVHVEDGFGPEEQSVQIGRRVLTRGSPCGEAPWSCHR
jgi:hypothetical protein